MKHKYKVSVMVRFRFGVKTLNGNRRMEEGERVERRIED